MLGCSLDEREHLFGAKWLDLSLWLLVASIGTSVDNATTPSIITLHSGKPAVVEPATNAGIAKVTVFSLTHPSLPPDLLVAPEAGKELAAVDVKVCAGSAGSQDGPTWLRFDLVFADGTDVFPIPIVGVNPSLYDVNGVCAFGWVRVRV